MKLDTSREMTQRKEEVMPQRVGNVELYMGPTGVGGPDDLQQDSENWDTVRRRLEGLPARRRGR